MRQTIYAFGDFQMDPVSRSLKRHGVEVPLTGRQFDLLAALVRRGPAPTPAAELAETAWPDAHLSDDNVRRHIKDLRQILGKNAEAKDYIVTIPNRGYQLAVPVAVGRNDRWARLAWPMALAATLLLAFVVARLAQSRISPPVRPLPLPAGRLLARATMEGGRLVHVPLSAVPSYLAISPGGGTLFSTSLGSRELSIVNTADLTVRTLDLPREGGPMAVAPDGTVYVGSTREDIAVVAPGPDGRMAVREVIRTGGPVHDMAITPDGERVFLAMENAGAKRWSTAAKTLAQLTDRVCPERLAMDPEGKTLYVAYQCYGPSGRKGHDTVEVFDVRTEKSLGVIGGIPMVGASPAISPDGKVILLDGGDACWNPHYDHAGCPAVPSHVLHLFRTAGRQLLQTVAYPPQFTSPVRFVDNRRYIVVGSAISVFDSVTFAALERLDAGRSNFGASVAAPDGRRLYVGSEAPVGVLVLEPENAACEQPKQGLALFYPADGTFADVADEFNLTPRGAVAFAPGKVGQAFQFNGGTLSTPSMGHFDAYMGSNDMSLSLYARLDQSSSREVLLDWTADAPMRGMRLTFSGGTFAFESWPGHTLLRGKTTVTANTWYHLAVTRTEREMTLYVNGAPADRQPAPPPVGVTDAALVLGGYNSGKAAFHGRLDEAAFYSRALSAQEIRGLYQLRESGPCKLSTASLPGPGKTSGDPE